MNIPTQLCSKCHKDFMNCTCENFHPNYLIGAPDNLSDALFAECYTILNEKSSFLASKFFNNYKGNYRFTIEELKAIYRTIERMYIDYQDKEAHDVFNKIAKIVKEK